MKQVTALTNRVDLGIWTSNQQERQRSWDSRESKSPLGESGREIQEFCEWSIPLWRKFFPENMDGVSAEQLWQAVNLVKPGLIRVDADEATYNLHIMIRYEIEKQLIAGEIDVDDLPDAWDEMYHEYLGIRALTVHWGCFRIFTGQWVQSATSQLTLGNLYAAQLLESARKDLPEHDTQIREELLPTTQMDEG